mmetsp:Transcript_92593/g.245962  ORF Transcript_92593/g.245962 Transcript_92593/m.245962 type:complete len:303 (-) Transcript_92593:73-981(-)
MTVALHAPMLGPLAGGVIAGVLHTVLGPDHLCTIATLSACQGPEAFGFGVRWAGGHLAGLGLVAFVLAVLSSRCSSAAFQAYERYADYAIGSLLIAFGGYFLLRSGEYFDAEWAPKSATCACHSGGCEADFESCRESESEEEAVGDAAGEASERTPLLPEEKAHAHGHHAGDFRRIGSVLMGFAQGVACPAGIVGMAFLQQYARSPWQLFVFAVIFFVVTSLAMGCMAMTYGMLTQRCVSSKSLARSIYGTSCLLSILLGLTWIILTATDRLHDYLGHDHEDHGWLHGKDGTKAFLMLAAPR